MPISYENALSELRKESEKFRRDGEYVSLLEALDRVAACDVKSIRNTPEHSTSAMDGYALDSAQTAGATTSNPVFFRVSGTMAAGDLPQVVQRPKNSEAICVEIMTGARFPESKDGLDFDACVPIENVEPTTRDSGTWIKLTRPVSKYQHRRFAGNDFASGDVIVKKSESIGPKHVMALASVGAEKVQVFRRIRIGLFSTGAELQPDAKNATSIPDVNKPYIMASLGRLKDVDVTFLGVLKDSLDDVASNVRKAVESRQFDVLLSTGAVSAGKFDFIRPAIDSLGGRIVFHKVAMRPGHPVMMAMLGESSPTAFFGLPGNPLAAAVCLRFVVFEFLAHLGIFLPDAPCCAILSNGYAAQSGAAPGTRGACETRGQGKDEFRHGMLLQGQDGKPVRCFLSEDQSPAKAKPFLHSNCFVHIPPEYDGSSAGVKLKCYPLG